MALQPAERVQVEHVSSHCAMHVFSVRVQFERQLDPAHRIVHC